MKKILLFLLLITGGLIITGHSPEKNRIINPKNKDIFIKGKLTFKDKNVPTLRFWIEGDNGYYSLIIFEENNINSNNHLQNTSDTVNTVFRERVCSSLKCHTFNEDGTIYFVTDFNNKEIKDKKGIKLIYFGHQVVKEIQEKIKAKASGHFVL